MGRVLTNTITLEVAAESALGIQPTAGWKTIEPNSIGKFGPMLKKIAREPISKNRQRRKGALVDLDSSVEFECDITYDRMRMFVEGLFFATAKGGVNFTPTAVTATGYTVASGGAIADGTLFYARGFSDPANNGLKIAAGVSTGTEVKAAGLVAEVTPPLGAIIEICGVQGAVGDLDIDASGNLVSTALNWTTTDVQVGQFIFIGGLSTTSALNFTNTVNRGLARVLSVAAGLLTLDKKSTTFVVEADATQTVQVFWGQYIRNVAVDSADYLERTYHFELGYENLAGSGVDKYEYAEGNFANEIVFDLPVTSKGTMKCNFIGTDCLDPTLTRATGAATPIPAVGTVPINTSGDFVRLRVTDVDELGLTTDFKSLTLTIKNNVSPEKVLGTLGGKYMNAGLFDVEIDGQILFTDSGVLEAMRANETLTMEVCIRNEDGGFIFDVPSMCIEGGDKDFPVNQTVGIQMKALAFQDARFGSSISLSTFPYMPL